jgi:hypothetical protein
MFPMAPFLFAEITRDKKYQPLARLAYGKELVECRMPRMIIANNSRLRQAHPDQDRSGYQPARRPHYKSGSKGGGS